MTRAVNAAGKFQDLILATIRGLIPGKIESARGRIEGMRCESILARSIAAAASEGGPEALVGSGRVIRSWLFEEMSRRIKRRPSRLDP